MSRAKFFRFYTLIVSSIMLLACTHQPATIPPTMEKNIRFLALGDSYTIGEGVDSAQRWPVQLTEALRQQGLQIENPLIIARTGWTTGNLLSAIAEANPQGPFDLVTLLIGVNNQYQGRDQETYRQEFRILLGLAIDLAGGDPSKVLVLSIPDWGVTPFARDRDRDQIRLEIDQFNAINLDETRAAGAYYLDITPNSRQAANDPALLAPDELHPSAKMYAAWVELMLLQAKVILR